MAESVKVIVRCRPMNQRENNLNCKACIKCDDALNKVTIFKPDDKSAAPKNFTFDGAYFTQSTTKQIYEDVGFALVDGVLEGYNGTGMIPTLGFLLMCVFISSLLSYST